MNDKKRVAVLVAGLASVATSVLGWMIHVEYESIELGREEVTDMRESIKRKRDLIEETNRIEDAVILLRGTEEVVRDITRSELESSRFVREIHSQATRSQVAVTRIARVDQPSGAVENAPPLKIRTYELTFVGDAFQLLSFVDCIESSEEFTRVVRFSVNSMPIESAQSENVAARTIVMTIEFPMYPDQIVLTRVSIDDYARRRRQLRSEIARQCRALRREPYTYDEVPDRPDPWVDPRAASTRDQ
jgi:hypothetical protein